MIAFSRSRRSSTAAPCRFVLSKIALSSVVRGRIALCLMLAASGSVLCQSAPLAIEPVDSADSVDSVASLNSALVGLIKDADRFYQQQQYENVVDLLNAHLAQGIKHPSIWLRLGNALHQLQRLDEAQAVYRMAANYPLPDVSQLGYIEAARINGKAWLNLASLNLTLAKQALAGFRAQGIPNADQNRVLQEQAQVAETLRRSLIDLPSNRSSQKSPMPTAQNPPSKAHLMASDFKDGEVTIEYLHGAPTTPMKNRR